MTGWGMRGERTARGGRDGVHCAAQSYDGSVIVSNRYVERDGKEELEIRVGTSDYSSCYSDWSSHDFIGSFEEFKELLKLHSDIKNGRVSVVRHRQPKQAS